MHDSKQISEDMKSIVKNITVYDKLVEIEKQIDEKLYKTRLEVQENLIMPSNRAKGLLRTHIYSYIHKETYTVPCNNNSISSGFAGAENQSLISQQQQMEIDDSSINNNNNNIENQIKETNIDNLNNNNNNINFNAGEGYQNYITKEKHFWVLRIQGRLKPILDSQPGGFYRKFSYYFNKILIKFSPENSEKYQDIDWQRVPNADIDSFEIKRPIADFEAFKLSGGIKLKLYFFVNYLQQEFKLREDLANLLGITQDSRPRILNHLWQYIKINSLQDNENPIFVNLNREMQRIFKTEKLDLSTLTVKLSDFIRSIEPAEIEFCVKDNFNAEKSCENQKLFDFIVNVDDPHFLDISNFLSNIDNESILFPKSLFFYKNENQQKNEKSQHSLADSFYAKIGDFDRNIQDLSEKLKKLKYKYDFYEAYAKDPKRFVDNFLQQQNSLLKVMKDESSIIDARWDYYSAQYYKDYEVFFFFLFLYFYLIGIYLLFIFCFFSCDFVMIRRK